MIIIKNLKNKIIKNLLILNTTLAITKTKVSNDPNITNDAFIDFHCY